MLRCRGLLFRIGWILFAVGDLLGWSTRGSAQQPVPGGDGGLLLEHAPPDGFDDLVGPRQALFDLYLDGQPVGSVSASVAPGSVMISDPEGVIAQLPKLTDREAVLAALKRPLESHAALSCLPF